MPVPYVSPRFQAIDGSGNPLVGGKLYTYANTTTTPQATYQDAAGNTANTNPIILDARGEAVIFLTENRTYTFVLKDQNDALIWSQDSIGGSETTQSSVSVVTALPTSNVGPVYLAGTGTYYWNGTQYVSDFSQGFGGLSFALKNKVMNGDFRIWQRGTSIGPIVAASGNTFTADRWRVGVGGSSSITAAQVSVTSDYGPNRVGAFALGLTSNASATPGASDLNALIHPIEGYNVIPFGFGSLWGGNVSLSFWVKASIVGTYSGAILNNGSPAFRAYIFTFPVNTASTWEYKTISIPVDTSSVSNWNRTNGLGINLTFDLGSGSTFEGVAGTWLSTQSTRATGSVRLIGTSGATFQISNVQLEAGLQSTPFEWRPVAMELGECSRYYTRTAGTARFTATASNMSISTAVFWTTEMRAVPSLTDSGGTSLNTSGIVANTATTTGAVLNIVSAAAGDCYVLNRTVTATAEL